MAQEGGECAVLDFTGQGVRRMELVPNAWPTTLIYDKNSLTKIENLDAYTDLQQLSVADNQLTRMIGVNQLTNLTVLSLPNNSIGSIEGLKNLTKLTWLSLSGNNIKLIEGLSTLTCLQHLDLSDNSISHVSDISSLINLRSLLLHGNIISSLRTASSHLPLSLNILSLAENEISDLNEVCHLANLQSLEQLSVMNNPCVVMTGATAGFDYRPFVVNWCLNLHILDGYVVSEKESLKAEWLYSQGKGRHFRSGQHFQLSQYLASVCPLTGAQDLESLEEQRLSRILQHQRRLQQELGEGDKSTIKSEGSSVKDTTNSQEVLRSNQHSVSPVIPPISQPSGRDEGISPANKMEGIQSDLRSVASPMRAWMQDKADFPEMSRPFTAPGHRKEGNGGGSQNDVELQDFTSEDESRSSASQLSCETRYLPLHSDSSSPAQSFQGLVSNPGNMRPVTAPPGVKPHGHVTSFAEIFANVEREQRPATALEVGRHAANKSRMAANFGSSVKTPSLAPTPSDTRPQPHHHKSPVSPLLKAKDFQDTDSESISTDASSASLEIKVLKALLNNHKAQKSKPKKGHSGASPYKSDQKSNENNDGERFYKTDRHQETLSDMQSDKNDNIEDLARVLAATKLQALWRGFKARHKDPEVVRIRTEIRAKRAEQHIRQLMGEVSRQRDLYEQEKQMRLLQLEAVKHLWKEVQSLQQWKQEVLASHEYSFHSHDGKTTSSHQQQSTQELINNLNESSNAFNPSVAVGASVAVNQVPKLAIPIPAPSKSLDMASAKSLSGAQNKQLKQLQQQVSHLQEVVQSVYQGNIIGAAGKDPYAVAASMVSESIRISTDFEDNQEKEFTGQMESEGGAERIMPAAGIPTAPGHINYQIQDKNCIVLRWVPSSIYDVLGHPTSQPLIGYRLYINERAKALVGGTKTCALMEGLHEQVTYRIFIRAVSALGESENSNTVIVCLGKDNPEVKENAPPKNDPDGSSYTGNSSGNFSKGPKKDQHGKNEPENRQKESSSHNSDSQSHHGLMVPSKTEKNINEGSSLITGDSGYLSSPCNTANAPGKQNESPSKDLAKTHAAMIPTQDSRSRKATVGELLEKRLHGSKSSPENSAKVNVEETHIWSERVHSSPRMKEGLFKKLDQQPVKKGIMREELMAAKIKKRSLESPMKAIAVDESSADNVDSDLTDSTKHRNVLPMQRRRSSSGSDRDDSRQDSSFSRENPAYHSYTKPRSSPSGIPRPMSRTSSKEVIVYNPDLDDADSSTINPSDVELGTSQVVTGTPKSRSRDSSTPGSREASRSGSVETLTSDSKDSQAQTKSPSEIKIDNSIENDRLDSLSERIIGAHKDGLGNMLERYVRGRASARVARSAPKVHVDEKRSSSAGASTKKIHEKPPLAKPSPGKDRRSMPREEMKFSRRRTKSDQSQPSSEDEEGRTSRNRHNSGTPSSGSDKEGNESRQKSGGTLDSKDLPPKRQVLSHKRSSSDVVFKPLPNRPISPASPASKPSAASTPQQALNSPRFRRSSSFSKSVTGEGKDAESILRQCISLELLKAAKQQDVRAAAERAIAAAEGSTSLDVGTPSQAEFNLARSRINASVIVRQSIERLNRKDPKYKSDTPLRGRSHSLSNSAKKAKGKSSQMGKPSTQSSQTAPAALSSPSKQNQDKTKPTETKDEQAPLEPSTSSHENNAEIKPIQSDSIPQVTSKSSDSSNSSSPESSTEKSSKRHKFGNKAHDLFQKLHMKLSANKP